MSGPLATFRLVQLGCAKNQVDGEVMAGLLARAGLRPAGRPEDADLIVVNTCGFLEAARRESIGAIVDEAAYKRTGRCRVLVVAGCLPQRHARELARALPEVDLFLGAGEFPRVAQRAAAIARRGGSAPRVVVGPPRYLYDADTPRLATLGSAYLKIAEGCSNHCAYCLIGRIRGPHRSRRADDVAAEAARLAAGARELCLVAQDGTRYGRDLSPRADLAGLLPRVAAAAPGAWIRLLYLHPARVTDRLLDAIAGTPGVCRYLDVPVQHASDPVLRAMGRPTTRADLERLVRRIRDRVPGAAIRTSLIVGHPGEGRREFAELLAFVQASALDHVGVFVYSPEEGTRSARLADRVSTRAATLRRDRVLEAQAAISQRINEARVGEERTVLIERESARFPGHFEGRTEFQAPEVDGITLVTGEGLRVGEFARVRIEEATCYDLAGAVVDDARR
jgi:ribosomal protein S12 methylthiotransferase